MVRVHVHDIEMLIRKPGNAVKGIGANDPDVACPGKSSLHVLIILLLSCVGIVAKVLPVNFPGKIRKMLCAIGRWIVLRDVESPVVDKMQLRWVSCIEYPL